ncbi:MAG: hypothetical protein RMJ82_00685 [Gemmatales bacterium]|nr:hypothetical protein [Gemmatales bacterium]
MLLRNFLLFDPVAEYDPDTGHWEIFSRKAEPGRLTEEFSGFYDYLNGELVLLYRKHGRLWLEVQGKRLPLDEHVVEVKKLKGVSRRFRVLSREGVVLAEFEYQLAQDAVESLKDPFPPFGITEEDVDFGAYLQELSHNRMRQEILLGLRPHD